MLAYYIDGMFSSLLYIYIKICVTSTYAIDLGALFAHSNVYFYMGFGQENIIVNLYTFDEVDYPVPPSFSGEGKGGASQLRDGLGRTSSIGRSPGRAMRPSPRGPRVELRAGTWVRDSYAICLDGHGLPWCFS